MIKHNNNILREVLHINLIIIMWWGPKHQYFPKSQVVKWKYWPRIQSCIWKSSIASSLKWRSIKLFSNAYNLLIVGGTTTCTSYLRRGSALSSLCHSGEEAVPLVKSEKERFPWSFSKDEFMTSLSLHWRTTWTRDTSFWDLLSTSPTIELTIPILPSPIKVGPYPMVEREQSYVVAFTLWPKSVGWG